MTDLVIKETELEIKADKVIENDDPFRPLTPKEIVRELDKYIVGQTKAKRAVAIALRNRWRRQQVPEELRDEIAPKNIIMIGPTGVGKTEIARRLAKLAQAPFLKIEASKFTEVGYVGRDVESMIRDLTELAVNMIKEEEQEYVREKAEQIAEEKVLDLLLPPPPARKPKEEPTEIASENFVIKPKESIETDSYQRTREKFREQLRKGKFDNTEVEIITPDRSNMPMVEIFSSAGMEEMDINFKDMLGNIFPKKTKNRKVLVPEAMEILAQEEAGKLIDMEQVVEMALERVEQSGIIFLDEIDKIAGREKGQGPDVSREGVQRDLLPIIEGSTVNTKYGMVRTDHVLFIAAGAFNVSKPSDLIPELQGRFPIRVELDSLTEEDFIRILTEPKNALIKQYSALMMTEDIKITFAQEAIKKIASIASMVNQRTENIGARRLHTVMERLIEELSFNAPDLKKKKYTIDAQYVDKQLEEILENEDLSKYIL